MSFRFSGWPRWSAPTALCPQTAARPQEACKSSPIISNIFTWFSLDYEFPSFFFLYIFKQILQKTTTTFWPNVKKKKKCCPCLLIFDFIITLRYIPVYLSWVAQKTCLACFQCMKTSQEIIRWLPTFLKTSESVWELRKVFERAEEMWSKEGGGQWDVVEYSRKDRTVMD